MEENHITSQHGNTEKSVEKRENDKLVELQIEQNGSKIINNYV